MPRGRAGRVGRGRPAYQRFNWFTRGGAVPAYGSYDSGYITGMGSAAASWVALAAIASVLEADASSTATFESTQAEVSITDAQMLGQASATFAGAALNGGAMTSEGDQAAAWLASGTGTLAMEGDVNVEGEGALEADGSSTMSIVAGAVIRGALDADGAGAASFEATWLTSSQATLSSAGAGAVTLVGAGTASAAANMPGVSDGDLIGAHAAPATMNSAGSASASLVGDATTGGGGVAPSVVQSTSNVSAGDSNTVAVTMGSNVTSGNLLVIKAAAYATGITNFTVGMLSKTAGTATIGTITLDVQTDRADGAPHNMVGIWSVPITGTGSLTMTLDMNTGGAEDFPVLSCSEISNADTSGTRVNATASANSSTSTAGASGNVATGGAGIIIGALAPGNPYGTITATPDGAFTTISEQEDDAQFNHSFIYRSVTTDTTDSADVTWGTSSQWVAVAVAYKSSSP